MSISHILRHPSNLTPTDMPSGFVSLAGIVDSTGKSVSFDKALGYGWITNPTRKVDPKWEIGKEFPLGDNLFVDTGRQVMAYALGGRTPVGNYSVYGFGVGTSTVPPSASDVRLLRHVPFNTGEPVQNFVARNIKVVDSVTYPEPFKIRVQCTLGVNDCNGYLLTEFGIYTGLGVLIAREVSKGINKTSDWQPTIVWRCRT